MTVPVTLTASPRKVSKSPLLFLFFHKRLCGPIANSCFHHRPDPHHRRNSQLEAAYHRADKAIQKRLSMYRRRMTSRRIVELFLSMIFKVRI